MPRKPLQDPVPLQALLEQAFRRLGFGGSFSRYKVLQLWPRLVGKVVARHSVAEKVTGSVLHVAVDSSGWMNELSAMKSVLLEKIASCLDPESPPITDIRFRQCSWVSREDAPKPEPQVPEPTREELRLMEEALGSVKDEELKEVFRRVMEKHRRLDHLRRTES